MAATEIRNRPAALAENKAEELSEKVAQQVSEIVEGAGQREKVAQPVFGLSCAQSRRPLLLLEEIRVTTPKSEREPGSQRTTDTDI